MKDQLTLLHRTDWDVLVVLDACRYDVFREVTGMGEPVRSIARYTFQWVKRVWGELARRNVRYYCANPKADRTMTKLPAGADPVRIHARGWSFHTPAQIPSVHPAVVNSVVLSDHCGGRLKGRKIVVHYLQPHSPYIGRYPLRVGRWGRHKDGLAGACSALENPEQAVARGAVTWEQVRAAYRANVELVWFDGVLPLVGSLPGTIVITSDHGELLGEEVKGTSRFGHETNWKHPKLLEVPWLVRQGGNQPPPTTDQKLEALGYK